MDSKKLIFVGLLLATLLLISSEVKAKEATETSTSQSTTAGGYSLDQYGCRHRCCDIYHGKCRRCCSYEGEAMEKAAGGYSLDQYGCRHKCCDVYHGKCRRCCSYEGEAMEKGN